MQKIKQFIISNQGKDVLIIIIIVLVGLGSFQLGRLSSGDIEPKIDIKYGSQSAKAIESFEDGQNIKENDLAKNHEYAGIDLTGRHYFGSTRGKKYYPFGCSAGKSIKEENRIYFDTKEQAESRGYTPSASCK